MDDLLLQMGARISTRRKQLKLTQEELAERAELTCQTISTAETGKKALRPENIIRLSIGTWRISSTAILQRYPIRRRRTVYNRTIQKSPIRRAAE